MPTRTAYAEPLHAVTASDATRSTVAAKPTAPLTAAVAADPQIQKNGLGGGIVV